MSHQRMFCVATEPNSMFREPLFGEGAWRVGTKFGFDNKFSLFSFELK